jgi:hypothetical protein
MHNISDTTIHMHIDPGSYIPTGTAERVAWIEQHGPQTGRARVDITADLRTWALLGREVNIDTNGAIAWTSYGPNPLQTALRERAVARLAAGERGADPNGPAITMTAADILLVVRGAEKARAEREAIEKAKAAERRAAVLLQGDEMCLRQEGSTWHVRRDYFPGAITPQDVIDALGAEVFDRAAKEAERRNTAVKAEAAAKRAPYDAGIRLLAEQQEDLARAATDGYPVERAVLDGLSNTLRAKVDDMSKALGLPHVLAAADRTSWGEQPDRAAPSPTAFRLLDVVTHACREVNETIPAAVGRWQVSRIIRLDVCHHLAPKHHYVTAVLATLETLTSIRELTFSLEAVECDHTDESSED